MTPDRLDDFGRFLEPSLVILVGLTDGPKHGYAVMEEAEDRWGYPRGPGTLYGALARLEEHGLIEALPRRSAAGRTASPTKGGRCCGSTYERCARWPPTASDC